MTVHMMHGDCLELMASIPDGSIDLILCDLPYGTTACKWDTVIPFEPLWAQYKRIAKPNAAIVLTASQPFTSALVMSNPSDFKYVWYWRKSRPAGFTNAKLKPLKDVEDIVVFSEGMTANGSPNNMPYFPQGLEAVDVEWRRPTTYLGGDRGVNPARKNSKLQRKVEATGYPRQVLDFANPNYEVLHPTQKPVALMEYLIRTYTREGEMVLDNCAGSFTTGVACLNTGRNFIGIERDETYFKIGSDRMAKRADELKAAQAACGTTGNNRSDCQADLPLMVPENLGRV